MTYSFVPVPRFDDAIHYRVIGLHQYPPSDKQLTNDNHDTVSTMKKVPSESFLEDCVPTDWLQISDHKDFAGQKHDARRKMEMQLKVVNISRKKSLQRIELTAGFAHSLCLVL